MKNRHKIHKIMKKGHLRKFVKEMVQLLLTN